MSAPRVLVCGAVLGQPMGGVRRHNMELLPRVAKLLEARGGSLAVLEGRTPIAFTLPESIERIASDVPASPALLRAALESRAIEQALKDARERGRPFELVHTAHLPAPRALSVPYTLTIHDLRSLESEDTPLPRRLVAQQVVGAAVKHARRVFTVSEHVRRELVVRFALEPEGVCVIPNAADHFTPLARQAQTASSASQAATRGAGQRAGPAARLLSVGHVEPRKNLELVLRALALDRELPNLDIAGSSKGDERERLERLARELGVAERVHFLGSFDDADLPRLYARAACAVFPSKIEGFGIGVLEALRAHCPVAISRIPAHVEVAGESAPSFRPGDPSDCAHAIRAALNLDSAQIDALAQSSAHFSWNTSAQQWVDSLGSSDAARTARGGS